MSTGDPVDATREDVATMDASVAKPWDQELTVYEKITKWEKNSPNVAGELLQAVKDDRRAERAHRHHIEWAEYALRVTGVLLGFGSVITMAILAWHFVDAGAPTQGASVLGVGTASVAAIFVTGKYAGRSGGRSVQQGEARRR
jgi:uncharacterized membrane protein